MKIYKALVVAAIVTFVVVVAPVAFRAIAMVAV